jgi:hypothetical protein
VGKVVDKWVKMGKSGLQVGESGYIINLIFFNVLGYARDEKDFP